MSLIRSVVRSGPSRAPFPRFALSVKCYVIATERGLPSANDPVRSLPDPLTFIFNT